MSELDTPFGRLKAARLAAGFRTAKEFSDTYGIPQPTYNKHETGVNGLRGDRPEFYASLLADRLPGITPEWLRYGAGDAPAGLAEGPQEEASPHDAIPYEPGNDEPPAPPILAALYPDTPGTLLYRATSDALYSAGVAPGDLLVCEPARMPVPGDLVVGEVYDWEAQSKQTVLRLFLPPYFVYHSGRRDAPPPLRNDDPSLSIRAVVLARVGRWYAL